MKFSPNNVSRRPSVGPTAAFTLTEIMVSMVIFLLVVIAMLSLQVFGLRMNTLTAAKSIFTAGGLKAMDQICNTIREATNSVLIGNYSNNSFTAVASAANQIGNAVQISNTAANYYTFYLNTSSNTLYEQAEANGATVLAHYVINTNGEPFQAENYLGTNIVTGSQHYTIHMTLLFSNMDYYMKSNRMELYQLETRATPRTQ
jgi:Tfp pilus assembly protein PilV